MNPRGDNQKLGESYADEKDRYNVNKDNCRVEPADSDREAKGGQLIGVNRWVH